MIRRLSVLLFVLAAASFLMLGCGEEEAKQTPKPPPEKVATKPATTPKTAEQPKPVEKKPEKKKIWPYLTKDHKVALADDFLARNYVMIFDGSGSMSETDCAGGRTKVSVAREAVNEWSSTVPAGANLGLVSFHSKSKAAVMQPLGTGNRDAFIKNIQTVEAGGKTPLTDAFYQAFILLEKQAQSQLGYGDYVIVVVTDGIANNPKKLTSAVKYLLKNTPIEIYTIGFCISGKHSLNQKGKTIYRAADNPEQLRQGLKEVLAESEDFDVTDFN